MARTFNRKGKPGKAGPLQVAHPDCAGIDIGSREHRVAIDPARSAEPVRQFGGFTDELEALADWLQQLRITAVAMEATGVYWIPLFELLDRRGVSAARTPLLRGVGGGGLLRGSDCR